MSAPSAKRTLRAKSLNQTAIVTALARESNGAANLTPGNVEIETDQIALLAYSYWEARGCQGGSPEEDWLRAQRQLQAGG